MTVKISNTRDRTARSVLLSVFLVLFLVSGHSGVSQMRERGGNHDSNSLERYIRSKQAGWSSHSRKPVTLVFLLRFINFGCTECLNSLLDFCDSLRLQELRHGRRDVMLMFVRDHDDESTQLRNMKSWAKGNDLRYPLCLVPQEIYDENNIGYSTVVLINSHDSIEEFEQIPLSEGVQLRLLGKLFTPQR